MSSDAASRKKENANGKEDRTSEATFAFQPWHMTTPGNNSTFGAPVPRGNLKTTVKPTWERGYSTVVRFLPKPKKEEYEDCIDPPTESEASGRQANALTSTVRLRSSAVSVLP